MARLAEGKAASPGAGADDADAGADRPRFVRMVGDQIYADLFSTLVPLGRADTYREFRDRYVTAFGSPRIRRLMQRLPAYMILDRPRDRGQLVPGPPPPVGQAPALHDRRGRLPELPVEPRPADVGPASEPV